MLSSKGVSQTNDYVFQDDYESKRFVFSNSQCNDRIINCDFNKRIVNVAFHPGGYVVGMEHLRTLDKKINFYVDSNSFFRLDFNTCNAEYLFSIKGDKKSGLGNLFYIDYLGRYYVEDIYQDLLYRTDLHDNTFKLVKSFSKNTNIYDMMFLKDKIYFIEHDSSYIYKCDTNWNIINKQHFDGLRITSLTNIHFSCDSTLIIIGTTNSTPEENLKGIFRPGNHFYSYDVENNKIIDSLCFYNPLDSVYGPFGLSSFSEFLSADPECDLLIDLDRDNSSGLFPYDYQTGSSLCLPSEEIPVCDMDLFVHTSFPLDSIVICISGAKNGQDEIIYSNSLPPGFKLNMNSDSCWTLYKFNGTDQEYTLALQNLRYQNLSTNRISGLRIIQFQGYNVIKKGGLIRTFIQVGDIVSAGITKLGNTLIALDSVATYQWVDCNDNFAAIPSATQKIYKPNRDGSYAVITNIPPCIDTSFCLSIILTRTISIDKQSVFVYPNPVTDRLFIQFLNPISGEIILMIRDMHERSVIKKVQILGEKKVIDVDVSGLVGGLYFLSIQSTFGANQVILSKM